MSLYNMLFGRNQAAELLLAMLNLAPADVGRFRDCYPSDDGTRIIVYTRNGGGNREQYQSVLDALSQHPCWIKDYDDDFDCTYASIEFKVPEPFAETVKKIADHTDTRPPAEKWKVMLDDLNNNKDTAQTARALEVGKRIFGAIQQGGSKTISTTEGSVVVKSFPPKDKS